MDYTQSPFLRGDDYSSEVADLRDNINELATDISQINITLTDDIRNVNERLNVYQNNIRQNVYTNKLEANVAEINNANIDDVFARNVKTNVLDVNVLNVASINNTILVNPHIENMDAVNGQILNAEIKNSVIVNGNGSFNSLNIDTVNIDSGFIKRTNIEDSTLTNVVINGFDLNNPRYLNVNNADFNVANFNNIYGRKADFDYIERVNTDNVRTTNIVVNGDARFHYLNANNANIRNITNTNISNAFLSNVRIKDNLILPANLIVNGIDANFIEVEDLNAKTIAVQELTDVNLIHANNVSSDWGYIQNLAAHNLVLDVSEEPRETPYVLGYDANGNIFPAIAQGGSGGGSVILPKDADYIYTDGQGLPLKGIAATDLNDSNALVKAELVAPLVEQINEIVGLLGQLNELKPNATLDYFNSASPLDYRTITAFETGKTTLKEKDNYTVVSDSLLGFTGLKVENNILHLDSTLNNFYLNKDLSYMFNGCSNFDGTGFDSIPEGTTNTAFMFADTKLKKPYKLPASVVNSISMYKNVLFETTEGEDIDGIYGVTFTVINNTLNTTITNSDVDFYNAGNLTINNTSLNITNSVVSFNAGTLGNTFRINGGDIYLDNVTVVPFANTYNANVVLKGDINSTYGYVGATFTGCEVNAVEVNSWVRGGVALIGGNVYIGDNTSVKSMFDLGPSFSWFFNSLPNIVYPYDRTNWAGLYYGSNGYDQNLLNNILPTATNVDEMFFGFRNKNAINISNMLGLLNKNITSLYRFQNGNAVYNTLTELKAVFPNAKNIGYSNLVKPYQDITEEEVAGFTDISGLGVRTPVGATNFNVPTLTTLENVFSASVNNVNIVVSNNCTFAPGVYNGYFNVYLTGDLSGIKNGYGLYPSAYQWFGYPENLESAPHMYDGAIFNEISEPIPNGLTNTDSMFANCFNITSIPGTMNLSNCMTARDMFAYCNNLISVDFNFLKTLKPGADISYMFYKCKNLVCNDINIFTYILEGVRANSWFGGKLVSDVNTNNESIIGMLNGLAVDGNVDISINTNSFLLGVINNKSLNIDIDITSLASNNYIFYNFASNKYDFSLTALPQQSVNITLGVYDIDSGNPNNSYFEVNGGYNVVFNGGSYTYTNNSRFVFTNVNNALFNGSYYYGGPMMVMTDTTVDINNVKTLRFSIASCNNVHINQMPTNGFSLPSGITVDSPADIDVLDVYSFLTDVSFVDNRININTLNNGLEIGWYMNAFDIYLNSVGERGAITGDVNNITIHIPTNADLAAGLNNGTYGNFPSENIIQY